MHLSLEETFKRLQFTSAIENNEELVEITEDDLWPGQQEFTVSSYIKIFAEKECTLLDA